MTWKKYFILILVLLLLAATVVQAFSTKLAKRRYEIVSPKVSAPVKIALITDLHNCLYGSRQAELVQAIEDESPNAVILAGDIIDDRNISNDNTIFLLEQIADKFPCYYVTGNHEIWKGNIEDTKQLFSDYGVTVLDGKSEVLDVNGQKINICGVDDPDIGAEFWDQLSSALNGINLDDFTILAAHRPELIENYLSYDYDLILSGHAHGGQWRLPGLINGLYAPNQGWFPKYAGGLYPFQNATMVVSRGLAKNLNKIPRIFNRPEAVFINIVPQQP